MAKTRAVKVIFENGDAVHTTINGTDTEIKNYYKVGSWFNLGSVGDNMQQVKELVFLN